jgi:hypothetical protein
MKRIFTSLMAAFAVSASFAQYYYVPYTDAKKNPGGLNTDVEYPVDGGISAGWTTVLAGNKTTPAWAKGKVPFSFSFNGNNVDSFAISSSGVLTFTTSAADAAAPAYASVALPSSTIPNNSVCILGIQTAGNNSQYANIVSKTFGTAPNRQYWLTFSAYNSIAAGTTGFCFFAIVLEETSNKIHIVDQRYAGATAKLSVGVQINSTTAVSVAGSPNLASVATSSPESGDNGYYTFIPGTQPANDLEGKAVTMDDYLILNNGPFQVKGVLRNTGAQPVTNFTLNYSINNGPTVSQTVNSVNIAKFATYNFTHTTNWAPAAIGSYTVKVWATNVNGNADENLTNDEVSKTVEVVDAFVERKALHEVFTSASCPPCRPGNVNLQTNVFPTREDKITVIKYQMNYPGNGDPYYTAEAGTRHSYYGVTSIPRLQIDGQWNASPTNYTVALLDQFQSKPSFVELSSTHTINWNRVNVNVKYKPLTDNNPTNMRLHVAIVEKQTFNNTATNGETEFENVMKKMVPNATGTAITGLVKNTEQTKAFNYSFPGPYRLPANGQAANIIKPTTEHSVEEFSDLAVVVFLQNNDNKLVLQSAWSVGTILSVEENKENDGAFGIFPNPSNGITQVAFRLDNSSDVRVNVYNMLGQIVKTVSADDLQPGLNQVNFDAAGLDKGMYIIQLEGNGWTRSERFMVQ